MKIDTKNPKEVGSLGGKKRWEKIPKKERSKIMKEVGSNRFPKKVPIL